MKNVSLLALIICGLWLPYAVAEVYKHIDENGNVTYSDVVSDGAETITIEEGNTIDLDVQDAAPRPTPMSTGSDADYSITINSPTQDATITPGDAGNFSVSASATPALSSGHQFQLLMDSQIQSTQNSSYFKLTNVDRGSHQLTVQIVDNEGKVVSSSNAVTVHVKRG